MVAAGHEVTTRPGSSTRVRANLAALRVVCALEAEHRPAREDELPQLAGWSGWGAVPQLFDRARPDYALHPTSWPS